MGSRNILLVITALLLSLRVAEAQGTFQSLDITFDGPPTIARGTGKIVGNYDEAGMSFTPVDPGAPWAGFVRNGGGIPGMPENGTAYLQAVVGSTLKLSLWNGSPFNCVSADLAGYSTVVPDAVFNFVGYRQDGTTVTADFSMNGIDFQTYYFGSGFSDLVRVELPNDYWGSLDNLVVSYDVPEPGAGTLLVVGAGLLGLRLLRRRTRS